VLVEGIGEIVALTPMAEGPQAGGQDLVSGDGAHLGGVGGGGRGLPHVVVGLDAPRASFEVSPEPLACTTFPLKKVGDRVNLERAVRLGDRLGGHLVTGHVDGARGVVRGSSGPARPIPG